MFMLTFKKFYWMILLILFYWQGAAAAEKFNSALLLSIVKPDTLQILQKSSGDSWVGRDKGLHLIGSMISTIAISKTSQTFFNNSHDQSLKLGISITFGLGLGKELWDSTKKNNKFSYKDLAADIIGILIGSTLLNLE